MFKKILIAEDHAAATLGITTALQELGNPQCHFFQYCDEALANIQKALKAKEPYDLLITDLSFDTDHRRTQIKNGRDLIIQARQSQPDLNIIVFSVEKRAKAIAPLYRDLHINGFVSKGRHDVQELKHTIKKVFENETVWPAEILAALRTNTIEFSDYDVLLLELLAKGSKQQEIGEYLRERGIKPDSKSSIEKRLNELRESLGAKNNIELIVISKDLGVI